MINKLVLDIFSKPNLLFKSTAFFSIIFFIYTLIFFHKYQHLPPPYFYDYSDTLMDFFNPLFYSDKGYKYTDWKSVYSTLSFVFAKLFFSNNVCLINSADPYILRDCDKSFYLIFIFIYLCLNLISAFLIRNSFNSKPDFIYIFVTLLLSPLNLLILERGNLFIFCLFFLVLFYIYYKNDYLSALFLAFLINLKIYFIFIPIILFSKRSYFRFFLTCFFTVTLYLVSLVIIYDPYHLSFLSNLIDFTLVKSSIDKSITANLFGSLGMYNLFEVSDKLLLSNLYFQNQIDFQFLFKFSICLWCFYVFLMCYKRSPAEILILLLIIFIQQIIDLGLYTLFGTILVLSSCIKYNYKFIYFIFLFLVPFDFFSIISDTGLIIYSWISDSFVTYKKVFNFGDIIRTVILFMLFIYTTLHMLTNYNNKILKKTTIERSLKDEKNTN